MKKLKAIGWKINFILLTLLVVFGNVKFAVSEECIICSGEITPQIEEKIKTYLAGR